MEKGLPSSVTSPSGDPTGRYVSTPHASSVIWTSIVSTLEFMAFFSYAQKEFHRKGATVLVTVVKFNIGE